MYDTQATRKSQGHGHAWLRKESTNFRFSRCMGGCFMATKLTRNGPLLTSTWSYNSQKWLYTWVSKGVTIPIKGFIPVIAILITGIGAHLAEPITTTAMITLLSCFFPCLIDWMISLISFVGRRNKLKVELGSEEQPKYVARRCPISFAKLEQTTTEGALRTKPNTMININKA